MAHFVLAHIVADGLGLTRFLSQTAEENLSYTDAIQGIIKSDGIQGLLGRGLGTRLVTNGLQVLILIKFLSSNAMLSPPCMCYRRHACLALARLSVGGLSQRLALPLALSL